MIGRLVSPIVVGRDRELAVIDAGLAAAVQGRTANLLIAGEAGVGKSRLVAEAIRAASDRGMRVVRGACVNIGATGVPYGPIVEVLRELHRGMDSAALDEAVGSSGPDLARLLPSLAAHDGAPEGSVQSEWLQARLLEALLGLMQRLAAQAPLLVVIEDLHWADPGTREALTYLIRNLRDEPIAFLVTYRSDELHRRHPLLPWLAEIERTGRLDRIDLSRLDAGQTRDLIAAIRGSEPSRELVDRVVERSDGNPFFVEELVKAEEGGSDRGVMPPTLREILLARIGALPDAAHAVVGVAAVAGRRVDHDLLAAVAGADETAILDALREAVSQQVLVVDTTTGAEGYAFRHALMQEAAYDDLLPGERRRLHRAFADAVAARVPGTGADAAAHWAELAYHWSAARDDRNALDASMRAARAAVDAYAFADALRHYESVLELWTSLDDPESVAGQDLADVYDAAAIVATLDGQAARAVALREAGVAQLPSDTDPARAALSLERLARSRWVAGDTAVAMRTYEEALAMAPADPPSPARARVQSGYGQMLFLTDRWEESRRHCEEALSLARATGLRQVEGHALCTLGADLAILGMTEEGFAAMEEAHAIGLEVGNFDDVGRANVNLANTMQNLGEIARAVEVARIGIVEDRKLGIASSYGAYLAHNLAAMLYDLGRWDEAAATSAEAFGFQHIDSALDRYGLSRLVPLLASRGDPSAETRLDQLGRLVEGKLHEGQFLGPHDLARIEFELWRGRVDAAVEIARRGVAAVSGEWLWEPNLKMVRMAARAAADLAEIGRAGRDKAAHGDAQALWDDIQAALDPFAAQLAERYHGAALAQARAELATIEAERARLTAEPQVEPWRAARDAWREFGAPYLLAYSRWRLGEALLVDGDRDTATTELREAHRLATELGAAPLRTALESLGARARIDLAPAPPSPAETAATEPSERSDPFGLTPREREVLALVSIGRTNRQIATELFISESTAGVHVSNILGKLGASTRTEAAGIAVRLGLAPSAVPAID